MKRCNGCRTDKEITEFGLDKYAPHGRRGRCKACRSAATRRNYKLNQEILCHFGGEREEPDPSDLLADDFGFEPLPEGDDENGPVDMTIGQYL